MVQLHKSSSSCRNLTFNGWENTDKLIAMQVTVHSTLHMQKRLETWWQLFTLHHDFCFTAIKDFFCSAACQMTATCFTAEEISCSFFLLMSDKTIWSVRGTCLCMCNNAKLISHVTALPLTLRWGSNIHWPGEFFGKRDHREEPALSNSWKKIHIKEVGTCCAEIKKTKGNALII